MGAEITPATGQEFMETVAKPKVTLMVAVFILFALLPLLAAAGQNSTASSADQLNYPCYLLPQNSQELDNLSSDLGSYSGLSEAEFASGGSAPVGRLQLGPVLRAKEHTCMDCGKLRRIRI